MTALVEFTLFFAGLIFIAALIIRICQEGDYDDYD